MESMEDLSVSPTEWQMNSYRKQSIFSWTSPEYSRNSRKNSRFGLPTSPSKLGISIQTKWLKLREGVTLKKHNKQFTRALQAVKNLQNGDGNSDSESEISKEDPHWARFFCSCGPGFKGLQLIRQEREAAEIEALEACKWLRAAGFPQYAQMYEDLQFPVDVGSVEKDHDFLDQDSIQSLFRRLNTLNKCATMKIETPTRKVEVDESDDEEQCALSDKWRFQRSSRRWSRKDADSPVLTDKQRLKSSSSRDSVITDNDSLSLQDDSPLLHTKTSHSPPAEHKKHIDFYLPDGSPPMPRFHGNVVTHLDIPQSAGVSDTESSTSPTSPRLHRSASEKVKNGAKNFLRRMDINNKSKKKKVPTATLR